MLIEEDLTGKIIGAAIEVHKNLGPGLLESAYNRCLAIELKTAGLNFDSENLLPIIYKGLQIDAAYRFDFLVEDKVIVEIKAVEMILPVHKAQIITYLKLANKKVGLLINFHSAMLKDGIYRVVF